MHIYKSLKNNLSIYSYFYEKIYIVMLCFQPFYHRGLFPIRKISSAHI